MKITIDNRYEKGNIKPLHCVNNGPIHKEGDQARSNLEYFKEAGIPYARNHDASFFSTYGGSHTVDVNFIFPDFSADPYDPKNYDFDFTDMYNKRIMLAGTKVFYRLGTKIEHGIKKYGTRVPENFKKYAIICEHIIRHMNEGWANGTCLGIEYWEIWNEANYCWDGDDFDVGNPETNSCWQGTPNEFFNFYSTVACHLKECFPSLKIGGPAHAGINEKWLEGFFNHLTKDGTRVPLDFFSWHIYEKTPEDVMALGDKAQKFLDKYGYTEAENILDEWNYVSSWSGEGFTNSIKTIISMKGAAFTAACMAKGQESPLDMMMYYDAAPAIWNGMFDYYTVKPLKGYYPFVFFNKLYKMGTCIESSSDDENIYTVAARSKKGKIGIMVSYYTNEENMPEKTLTLPGFLISGKVFLLDDEHNAEEIGDLWENSITMKPNTVIYIEK